MIKQIQKIQNEDKNKTNWMKIKHVKWRYKIQKDDKKLKMIV